MSRQRIGLILGSNRAGSINRLYALALTRLGGGWFDFAPIENRPLFNQVFECALPESVRRFKAPLAGCDTLLFVTPEDNRSNCAVLKRALDWGWRPFGQNATSGKRATMTDTTPVALGAAFVQQRLRQIFTTLGVLVMSREVNITLTPGLFADDGALAD